MCKIIKLFKGIFLAENNWVRSCSDGDKPFFTIKQIVMGIVMRLIIQLLNGRERG